MTGARCCKEDYEAQEPLMCGGEGHTGGAVSLCRDLLIPCLLLERIEHKQVEQTQTCKSPSGTCRLCGVSLRTISDPTILTSGKGVALSQRLSGLCINTGLCVYALRMILPLPPRKSRTPLPLACVASWLLSGEVDEVDFRKAIYRQHSFHARLDIISCLPFRIAFFTHIVDER